MLQAYRRYFDAVLAGYFASRSSDAMSHTRLARLRQDARLARSNAEASLSRLASEAASPREVVERYRGVLASANRCVTAAMALEALLLERGAASTGDALPALATFVQDAAGALDHLTNALSFSNGKLEAMPDLAADVHALWEAVVRASERYPDATTWMALTATECDRITDAVNSIAELLRGEIGAPSAVA